MKIKQIFFSLLALLFVFPSCVSDPHKKAFDQNKVILITLDGLRWQELFGGADSALMVNKKYVASVEQLTKDFWRDSKEERRAVLFPFLTVEMANQAVFFGDRLNGSYFDVTNKMWFSYPGYNEILTGAADDVNVRSNDRVPNPNVTVLEVINNSEKYSGRVFAFGSWDRFPFILNEERSGIPVNGGFRNALNESPTAAELLLDKVQAETPRRWSDVRYDTFTHNYALETLKRDKPSLLYVAYGETDDFAHSGLYNHYLYSAQVNDKMIKELWDYTQSDPFYKGKTTFILTTDHGRGIGDEPGRMWRSHGSSIENSGETWAILFGAGVDKANYDVKGEFGANQVAATIAQILSVDYAPEKKIGKSLLK